MNGLISTFSLSNFSWFNALWFLNHRIRAIAVILQRIIFFCGATLTQQIKHHPHSVRTLFRHSNTLIFDEAVINLDQTTSEQFTQTINWVKGKVTILFTTHQLPKGLHVDEVILLAKDAEETNQQQEGNSKANKMDVVE